MSYTKSAAYLVDVEEWRADKEAELRASDGWLSLTGLFVLDEGLHTIGSHLENDIQLPASAPDQVGTILFSNGRARLTVTTSDVVLADGEPVRQVDLTDNGDRKQPTLITLGTITFFVHKFGDLYAIRVKDATNPVIQAFQGREWFAVKPEYLVQGKFTPHAAPQAIPIKTILETNSHYKSVGVIDFELNGQRLSLLATELGNPNRLHVVFRDATAGIETYGPARFLSVELGEDENVVVDFNKAYNPPCAFSPYATCPLPPPENILPVAIAAGERFSAAKSVAHHQPVVEQVAL